VHQNGDVLDRCLLYCSFPSILAWWQSSGIH